MAKPLNLTDTRTLTNQQKEKKVKSAPTKLYNKKWYYPQNFTIKSDTKLQKISAGRINGNF